MNPDLQAGRLQKKVHLDAFFILLASIGQKRVEIQQQHWAMQGETQPTGQKVQDAISHHC